MTAGPSLEHHAMLPILRKEGDLLVEAIEASDPTAPVPMCPGWTVTDLAVHTAGVLRWVNVVVREQRDKPPVGEERSALFADPEPTDHAGVVKRLRHASDAILDTLHEAPVDLACWTTWEPPGSPRQFWLRRMLHEIVVHRVDAGNAELQTIDSGGELNTAVAADGVDEIMVGFASRYSKTLRADRPVVLSVHATDADRQWWASISDEAPSFGRGTPQGPVDAAVRGTAGEVLLLLWNRREAAGLNLVGDAGVLVIWRSRAHL
jgi:uncharacterized protein (TIGR03083 family)